MQMPGHVYLVGAGPGPVDLLTVRARRCLQTADVLAYDELVHPDLLQLVPAHCEILGIGYRAGQTAERPPPLHPIVLERALAGRKVVRLKAGDPMIFARAGEEAAALAKAGVPFSVIPGITAALAAASSCHLPLTWRGRSAEVRLTTASLRPSSASQRPTLALYMPRQGLRAYTLDLMREGWSPDTPAAYVMAAAQRRELCVRSTLQSLADHVEEQGCDRPGVVILGETLREELPRPRRPLPLQGLPILLARAHTDASSIGKRLRSLGADVWEWPWVKGKPASAEFSLQDRLLEVRRILVPEAQLWSFFLRQLKEAGLDLRSLHRTEIWTLGREAKKAVERSGITPNRELARIEGLRKMGGNLQGRSLLLCFAEDRTPAATAILESSLDMTRWVVGTKLTQYPRLPQVKPRYLVLPHLKALDVLGAGPSGYSDLMSMEVVCFGESLREALQDLGWSEERIQVVKNIEMLVHTLKEPKPPHLEEDLYVSGTSDSLYGSWQG